MKLKSVAFCLSVLCTSGLMAKQDTSKPDTGKMTSQTAPAGPARQPHGIRVNEDIQKAKLVHLVPPFYPPLLGKRLDGAVVLRAIVGQDGAKSPNEVIQVLTRLSGMWISSECAVIRPQLAAGLEIGSS